MTTDRDENGLERLLAEARDAARPSDDLVARVLADAAAAQAAHRPGPAAAPSAGLVPAQGWLGAIASALGGWPGVSGVTLAGIAGLAMGFWVPDLVDSWSGGQIWMLSGGGGTMPEIGLLWEEAGDV